MKHILDLDHDEAPEYEFFIEEIETLQTRASTSDCMSSASSVATAGGSTVGSFSSMGSVASTGGGC